MSYGKRGEGCHRQCAHAVTATQSENCKVCCPRSVQILFSTKTVEERARRNGPLQVEVL